MAIHQEYRAKADAMESETETPEDAMTHPIASRGVEKRGSDIDS